MTKKVWSEEMKTIKIIIAGPRGRMGKEAVTLAANTEHFDLVAVIDHKNDGMMLSDVEDFNLFPMYQSTPISKSVFKRLKQMY